MDKSKEGMERGTRMLTSKETVSTCPPLAARWSGVSPCTNEMSDLKRFLARESKKRTYFYNEVKTESGRMLAFEVMRVDVK